MNSVVEVYRAGCLSAVFSVNASKDWVNDFLVKKAFFFVVPDTKKLQSIDSLKGKAARRAIIHLYLFVLKIEQVVRLKALEWVRRHSNLLTIPEIDAYFRNFLVHFSEHRRAFVERQIATHWPFSSRSFTCRKGTSLITLASFFKSVTFIPERSCDHFFRYFEEGSYRLLRERCRPHIRCFYDRQALDYAVERELLTLAGRVERALMDAPGKEQTGPYIYLQAMWDVFSQQGGMGALLLESADKQSFTLPGHWLYYLDRTLKAWSTRSSIVEAIRSLSLEKPTQSPQEIYEALIQGIVVSVPFQTPVKFQFSVKVLTLFIHLNGDIALLSKRLKEATDFSNVHLEYCDSINFYGFKFRVTNEIPGATKGTFQFYAQGIDKSYASEWLVVFDSLEGHRKDNGLSKRLANQARNRTKQSRN